MGKALYKDYVGNQYIHKLQSGSDIILKTLNNKEPCLITRFGTTELSVLDYYLKNKAQSCQFPENLKINLADLSGFFPTSDHMLIKFCNDFISCIKNIDIVGVRWEAEDIYSWEMENSVCTTFCPNAELIEINQLTPLWNEHPWTSYLENKKVLVIHPFEKSIRAQYKNRKKIFSSDKLLPEFELLTLKAVQSLADEKNQLRYESWFDALSYMCEQIEHIDFDVSIIGAGAYGMFLGNFCKNLGKKAIHIGGGVQILFGIMGKRWNNIDCVSMFYNEYWVNPLAEEKPRGAERVENGCYW
ncbi:MAG: hypothetical protein A2X09_15070 [Bacteroidetes bacterium GWF2_43_11]|nr:MAG: hypothetical protein A2X09_15070 [Bacteroidetes bacterium GWF2_43_11]